VVILPTHQYETKLHNFIHNNDFHTGIIDLTPTFQNQIRTTIRQGQALIPKECRWKNINMNPSAPSIKGLIKMHKPDQPFRPVVNWRNARAYKLSRLFTDKINHLAPLPHTFNIKNTQELLKDLKDTPMLPHYKFASLDITNPHTNIPVLETRVILADILTRKLIDPITQQELLNWFDVITKQNYFTHKEQIIFQHDGLAMRAPSSGYAMNRHVL
jgi:hypothetical protein